MKKFLTLCTALLLFGSMTVVHAHTFTSGTTIYIDFRNVSGGADFPSASAATTQYKGDAGGTIQAVTFTANVTWNNGSTFIKTNTGGWANIGFTTPSSGQNCAVVSADGKSFTWTTVTNSNYTVYFKNNPDWTNVYVHLYNAGTTFGGNGVGGQAAAVNATMTKIDAGPYWKYEYSSVVKYTKVCFTKEAQNNYENFWENECSWSDGLDFDNGKVLWIPNTATSTPKNNCTYYNAGAWSEYPPVSPIVSFSGLPATVGVGQQVTFAATSENVSNPTYTFYVKKGSGSYGSAVTSYTFAETGSYTVKVEVRSNGIGSALDTKEETITCNPSYIVYFKNTPGWTNVYAHLYPSGQTFGDNGVGGQSAEINAAMTKIDDGPYWKLEYNSATKYTKVCFTKDFQDGYENFWQTECSWSTGLDFDNDLVLWIPSITSSDSQNSCTYYNSGIWSVYPPVDQSVVFDGLDAQILKGTAVNFEAIATNITNPVYSYYVKPADGEYGSAVTSYTFNAEGAYMVKVSVVGDNTTEPVVAEKNVTVYDEYTFTAGTRIYVDFTAVSDEDKGVNYPKNNEEGIDYDANGAGTFKTIRFSTDVTWSTLSDFIKTAKADWAGLKFTAPGEGQNKIIVAADGASYTWGTYTPATVQVKFFAPRDETNKWEHVYAYSWDAVGAITGWTTDEVTRDGDWYVYNVQVGANLLFHDGNGMQTKDINNIQAYACYESTEIDYESTPKKVTVTANANCKIAYHIAGSKNLIEGESEEGFDVNLPLDENNQIIFHDVEPGTYAFKINNGTWAWALGGNQHLSDEEGCGTIATEVGVGDVGFKIETMQDVTITYYPLTQKICLGAETVKADGEVTISDMAIKAGESKKIEYWTNNTENPGVTYTILSGSEYIGMFQNVITGIKEGTTTVRVSLAETANYTAASDEFTITVSNPVAPAKAIEAIGGKFIINAKGDTAIFSRGNLKYNVATGEWYCAEKQYDFVGEGGNLHFGDANYTGEFDLFGWSCTASNFGLMLSNHDEVYTGDFVDWGTKFSGEKTWSTLSSSQWQYMQAHQNWTMMVLDPTPEVAENEDEIRGMAVFPYDWVTPAGFESLRMKFYDLDDEEKLADNTIALADWSTLEAAGAVFLPMAGARAGHWGNNWNGKAETTTTNPNPNGGQSYCFVDNIGWYGYYWLATTDSRSDHPYDAMYLICPSAYNTGKKDEHDEEIWAWSAPAVWSREKRRGNSVRLVNIVPRQYAVTYTAGEGEGAVPTDENKYLDGEAINLASASGLSKEGYRFAGWKFKGTTYAAGASYTVNNVLANEQIVFEAQWEEDWQTVRENLSANAYYTMCLDKAVAEVRGGAIWRVLSKSDNSDNPGVILEEVIGTLDAGRPYIFYATAANLEVIYTGDAVGAPVNDADNNGLIGSFTQQSIAQSPNNYIIYNNELYYVNSDNVYVGAYRAYLDMTGVPAYNSEPQQGAPRRRVMMSVHAPAVATGVETVSGERLEVNGKILIDGQIYILRGEKVYDMTGRLVK